MKHDIGGGEVGWEQHKALTKLSSGFVGWLMAGGGGWWFFFHVKWELSPPVGCFFVTVDSYSWNQPFILQGQEVIDGAYESSQRFLLLSCILNACRKCKMCQNAVLLWVNSFCSFKQ